MGEGGEGEGGTWERMTEIVEGGGEGRRRVLVGRQVEFEFEVKRGGGEGWGVAGIGRALIGTVKIISQLLTYLLTYLLTNLLTYSLHLPWFAAACKMESPDIGSLASVLNYD